MQPLSDQAPDEVRRTGCSDDALSIDTASHQLCAVDMYEQMFNQVGSTYLKLRQLCDQSWSTVSAHPRAVSLGSLQIGGCGAGVEHHTRSSIGILLP